MKTAALIAAAAEAGAIAAGAPPAKRRALRAYGENLGLAFQIVDDVLDRVGDKSRLGKSGSDARNGKLTYPAVHGLDRSRAEAARLYRRALRAVSGFGPAADPLRLLAEHALTREK